MNLRVACLFIYLLYPFLVSEIWLSFQFEMFNELKCQYVTMLLLMQCIVVFCDIETSYSSIKGALILTGSSYLSGIQYLWVIG